MDIELIDLSIAGEKTSYGLDKVVSLASGKKKNLRIKISDFEKEDVEDNERVKVRAYYGERETSLVKVLEGNFDLVLRRADYVFYGLIFVIIILLGLISWKRKKKKRK